MDGLSWQVTKLPCDLMPGGALGPKKILDLDNGLDCATQAELFRRLLLPKATAVLVQESSNFSKHSVAVPTPSLQLKGWKMFHARDSALCGCGILWTALSEKKAP